MADRSSFTVYTRAEQEELMRECGFTPREERIFLMRAKSASVVETGLALHLSDRTVERDSGSIRRKIARVQHRRRETSRQEEYAK